MHKSVFAAITAISITITTITPVFAGGLEEAFAAQNSIRAGFYIRLPFAGGLKHTAQTDLNYGFAMSMGRALPRDSLLAPRRQFRADMMQLSFSSQGFDAFSFAGQNVLDRRGWRLGANESSGGVEPAAYLIGGIAALAGALLLVNGDELHDRNLLPCSGVIRNGQCVIID